MNTRRVASQIELPGIVVLLLTVAVAAQTSYPPRIGPNGPIYGQPPPPPGSTQPQNAVESTATQPSAGDATKGGAHASVPQPPSLQMPSSGQTSSHGSSSSGSGSTGIIRYTLHAGARPARRPAAADATAAPQANGVAGVSGSVANEYVIKRYDTLWDLARSFLGNPYDWQKIWSWNRAIQDPNLIYPGQQLSIQGYQAAGMAPADASLQTRGAGVSQRSFAEATEGFLDTGAAQAAKPASPAAADTSLGTFGTMGAITTFVEHTMLTTEFLENVPFLWTQRDAGGLLYPGDSRIDPESDRKSYQQFDEATVKILASGSYVPGDTVDVYRSIRMVTLGKQPANLVQRIAHGRVTEVKGKAFKVSLFKVWDVVQAGDRVAHMQHGVEALAIGSYVDPAATLRGAVFQRVEDSPMPYPYQTFIIDRGASEGIQRGDLFYAYPAKSVEESTRPIILACAAFTGDHYATLAIVKESGIELSAGDVVRLVKRVQYN